MTDMKKNNNDLKKCFRDNNGQVNFKMLFFGSSFLESEFLLMCFFIIISYLVEFSVMQWLGSY